MPLAEFESDLTVDAKRLKPDRFVYRHARLIGQRDAGEGGVKALRLQAGEQIAVQTPSDTSTPRVGRHIDGDIGRPLIGGARPVSASVGVARNLAAMVRDKEGVGSQGRPHPLGHLFDTGRRGLERDRRLGDDRRIDGRDGDRIALTGDPHLELIGGRHALAGAAW